MIILRTHVFGDRERRMVAALRAGQSQPVVIAADESRRVLDVGDAAKLSVTTAACRRIGLYCPADFAWRNGDYVFYLARRRFPTVERFWLIEPDVEHSFDSFRALFAFFDARPAIDLLAGHIEDATDDWYWFQTGRVRPTGIKRAFFPLVRMSTRAIDVCLRARRSGRFSLRDRLHWPNDEVFVATEVAHAGLAIADLNDLGRTVYRRETFDYTPLDGDTGALREIPDRIFHPVLHGEDFARRVDRIAGASDDRLTRCRRRLQRHL